MCIRDPRHPLPRAPSPLTPRHHPVPVAARTHALAAGLPRAIPPAAFPNNGRLCSSGRRAPQAHLSPRARPPAGKCGVPPPPNQPHSPHSRNSPHSPQTGACRSTATRSRTRVALRRAMPREHPSAGRSRHTSRYECGRGCRTARRTTIRFHSSPRAAVRASRQCPRVDESPDQTLRTQPCRKSAGHRPITADNHHPLRSGAAPSSRWRTTGATALLRPPCGTFI